MNLPTKLTVIRICLIPVFVVLFFVQFPYHAFVATGVFILACLTDFLDGYLARKRNEVTDLGKFLDPIADKMLVACALIAIITLFDGLWQMGVAVCAMIILSRELMVSGFRIVAASKNVVLAADIFGKIKTVLQMCALIILIPLADIEACIISAGASGVIFTVIWYIGLILLALSTIMAIVSGINYLVKNRQVFKA